MTDQENRRILIVDDNQAIHEDFLKILGGEAGGGEALADARSAFFGGEAEEELGVQFEIEDASQGDEGVERVREALAAGRPFSMAFVDVRMPPGIDGVQAIRGMWDADPNLQVVICTAYADYSLDEIAEELGNSDQLLILKKPFDPVEVKQLAASLTAKWNSAQRERARLEDLQAANQALEQANARAESASRVKSEFLANMSHEIRTPMTAILGYTDLLFDPDVSEEESESYKEIIRRSGQHLLVIINDILDLSKIEAGRMVLFPDEVRPGELAADVVAAQQADAKKKGLTLEVEVADGVPETITSDPVRVRQVLSNLVANAIKFTRKGAVQVVVGCTGAGESQMLQFDVTDSGIGIEPDKLSGLFDAFTQADYSSTRQAGGTGLGLAISKQLAIILGGDIEVESELGKGSTFRFALDASGTAAAGEIDTVSGAAAETAARTTSAAQTAPTADLHCHVLLVEDGRLNQVLISTILKKAGATIELADNGLQGVEKVVAAQQAGTPFQLVLMDMQMPVMDGYDATAKLREQGFEMPIVALTAHAMAGDRQKCLDAGCTEYATKPVDRRGLLAMCAELTALPNPPAPFPSKPAVDSPQNESAPGRG